MQDLTTPNLSAKFEAPIVRLNVTGSPSPEEVKAATEWFDALSDDQDTYDLYMEMPKMHFDGLGDVRQSFLSLANLMRGLESCGRCAVVTDSAFLRSSAQIEGSVLPNLEMNAFKIVELADAEEWLEAA